MRRRLSTALLVWAAWSALAVFFALTTSLTYISQNRPPLWGLVLAFALTQWWLWAALTPAVVWMSRRYPLARGHLAARVPLHLAAGLAVALVKVWLEGRARQWLFHVVPLLLISNLALQMLIYWALTAVVHAIDHYGRSRERAARIEARLGEARLELLRAQLRPHFLFNALNAVSELVHEDPDAADRMIGRLSELLRATLDAGDRQFVPLSAEIALAATYLSIQQTRFADRLRVTWNVDPRTTWMLVPHLVLQPLVENAVQHGIGPRAGGGTIDVSTSLEGDRLIVRVTDDGVGLPATGLVEGIGLANTRARLAALYGHVAALTVAAAKAGGVVVTLTLPRESAIAEPERAS